MNLILNQLNRYNIMALVMLLMAMGCKKHSYDRPGLVGVYQGEFAHGNFSTPIQIEIERDSIDYRVYFTSPDQNAYGIPISNVHRTNDSIYFELNSDLYSFRFHSWLSKDGKSLVGSLSVDSVTQTFELERTKATEDLSGQQEDISFESGGIKLAGTVYHPTGLSDKILYFVTSSGNSDRSATRAEAMKFRDLGFITFHVDKRGTGKSEGDWRSASIEELAMDDINAIKFISAKLGIPMKNIGIKGSSQGGTKVPYILSNMEGLGFGILVSCPSTSLLESDLNYWQNRNRSLIEDRYFGEALELERLVFQYIGGMINLETLNNAIVENRDNPWFSKVWIPNLEEVEIDDKLRFSPMPYFKTVNAPLLVIQGSKDEIIPEESSLEILRALKNPSNSKSVLLENANHAMQLVQNSDFPYWPMLHPEYFPTIEEWLNSL